jgi:dihydrolipoamide dehydrogenase
MTIGAHPFIAVDERMRIDLFAVGDVNGLSLLDSAAVAQARVAVDAVLGRTPAFLSVDPRCIHTDPPASISWNEEEAGKAGFDAISNSQIFDSLQTT